MVAVKGRKNSKNNELKGMKAQAPKSYRRVSPETLDKAAKLAIDMHRDALKELTRL